MYRQFHRHSPQKQNFNRFRPRSNRSAKTFKAFNPLDFINSLQANENEKEPEYLTSHSFADFQISADLKRNISQKGYAVPTPIQDQAIEPILAGRDFVGVANTGTGKTAAFLIPLINKVLNDRNQRVLILTPTRELAIQIKEELVDFSRSLGIYGCLCIGGENRARQIRDLSRNPHFIIATPGRIQDLIRAKIINLFNFSSVVIDEADRMVDIGFINDVKYIISLLPSQRQSLFFSATIDRKVQQVLQAFVKDPVTVSVKIKEAAQNITQKVICAESANRKVEILLELLVREDFAKVLIFGRTKRGVQRLSDELVHRGFKAGAIHGNKKQSQRTRTLNSFKRNEIKVLIATDVASRGLDIPNVSHVINYDLPESRDAYIHRIGRTGRADKKGIALTFIN